MTSFGLGVAVCAILVLSIVVAPCLGAVYTVGDSSGWTMGVDYSTWISDNTFNVGDSLVFNYGGGHTVDEVSASDYNTCTVGNAITTDNSGATTIVLKTAGAHYYICGVVGHCGSGMKLAVNVKAAASSGTSASPASSASPTTTSPASTGTNTTSIYKPSSSSTPIPESAASGIVSPFVAILVTFLGLFVMVFSF